MKKIVFVFLIFFSEYNSALAGYKNAEWGMTAHELAVARAPEFRKLNENSTFNFMVSKQKGKAELGFYDSLFETSPVEGAYVFKNGRLTAMAFKITSLASYLKLKDKVYEIFRRPVGAKRNITSDLECETFTGLWQNNNNDISLLSQVCNRGIGNVYWLEISASSDKIAEIEKMPKLDFSVNPNDEHSNSEIDIIIGLS